MSETFDPSESDRQRAARLEWRLDSHTKRLDEFISRVQVVEDECRKFPDHNRRLEKLERYDLAVINKTLSDLEADVKGLRKAFYTFAFSVVASSIVFAFTVFALLGGT